ncbi:IS481 family transposase (plasmid) [Cupriavidus sp. USMAHM13]|uniref:IS481 family transposase n=1 Tax=Cupriavidus sp. USMAHM13 TaxID=1389192 RepID=UPI0008A694C9|nr:IS481 family transposase [Cupriavidus sp. USMAHM13]AOZ04300.1 IS481 family transposase [Cupriavidus sp. USMAHM13]
MPWSPRDTMSLRHEFVLLAQQEGCNRRQLCQRYGISPQTGYKWIARYTEQEMAGLVERSRRPATSPTRTAEELERLVVALRLQHPAWGGRKISRRLQDLGHTPVPAPSTVTSILHRHGLISPEASVKAQPWQRFEHAAPNQLWQMDFKGGFRTHDGQMCSPLTVLDDHSRFAVTLAACTQTHTAVVQEHLAQAFRHFGLPWRINADNGAPWGSPSQPGQLTGLGVWLIRLGVRLTHSRPAHPQTNGKDERFHRTLKAEVINARGFASSLQAQHAFDAWRDIYNLQRPHEALGLATPVTRYQPSPRSYPEVLPEIEYGPDDLVVKIKWDGQLRFRGQTFKVSNALRDFPVALLPQPNHDGRFDLYFVDHCFGYID